MDKTWKARAHLRIRSIIEANPGADEKTLRTLISKAYPWGERTNHPYKAWCKAVQETFAHRTQYGIPPKPAKSTDYTDTPLFMEGA
jgi:hypothetical protein